MLIIMIRSVILYLLIVFALRLMGKKQLAELQPSELVTTILVSNIATLSLEDSSLPMIMGILPIIIIVCLDVFISQIMLKNARIRRIFTGSPQIIISDGKIDQKQMRNLRYNIDDLMEAMRECMIFDITEVQYAIVETNGKINFFQKSQFQNVEARQLSIVEESVNPPSLLIKDGEINISGLAECGFGEKELYEILNKNKIKLKNVFILTSDKNKNYTIIPKEKKEKEAS